jgi:sugar lactone lactonase YvrE
MKSFLSLLIGVTIHAVSFTQANESWNNTNGKAAASQLGQADFSGDVRNRTAGPPAANTLFSPGKVAVDSNAGKIYVVDTLNHRILRYATATALQDGSSAEAVFGQPDFVSSTPAADRNGLNEPFAAVVDFAGTLWVSDTGNHRVVAYENAATESNYPAADLFLGQPDELTTTSGTAADKFHTPMGLAFDTQANLWVADSSNHRVLFFARPSSEDGVADKVLGNSVFTQAVSGTTADRLYLPSDVAITADETLWVADRANNRVVRFDNVDTKMNGASADGVLGQTSFGPVAAGLSNAGFHMPESLSINPVGRLFVADSVNRRVLHFRAAASKPDGAPADGVLGKSVFTNNDAEMASATSTQKPVGVTCDGNGRIWVADESNNRVMRFQANDNSARIASIKRQIKKLKKAIKKAIKKAKKKKKKSALKRAKKKIRSLNRQLISLLQN